MAEERERLNFKSKLSLDRWHAIGRTACFVIVAFKQHFYDKETLQSRLLIVTHIFLHHKQIVLFHLTFLTRLRPRYIEPRGKSLLKIAYVIFVILKSHDFFSVSFGDFSDF